MYENESLFLIYILCSMLCIDALRSLTHSTIYSQEEKQILILKIKYFCSINFFKYKKISKTCDTYKWRKLKIKEDNYFYILI